MLLNHASAYQGSDHDSEGNPWGGHHLFGAPALEVYKSKVLQFADHPANESLHDAARSALLRICDAEVLDLVAAKHAAHQNDLKSLAQGVPIRGCDEICDRMIQAIRETDKTAVITHIVTTQKQIDILFRRSFSRWIQANVEAVQRGVHVTRVFLITRELMHDARIVAIANEMRRANIDVRFAVWEELDGGSRYDFSVYDDKRHIRILTQAGGGWGKDGTTDEEAVTTTDPLAINKFSQLFREISRGSRPFPVNPPVDEDPIEGQVQIVGGVAT